MPFIDILIFAAIALFLIFRLRSILGNRDGFEQERDDRTSFTSEPSAAQSHDDEASASEKIVSLHGDKAPINGKGLTAVRQADPSFRDDDFMKGAAAAFDMILTAFSDGDLQACAGCLDLSFIRNLPKAYMTAINVATGWTSKFMKLRMFSSSMQKYPIILHLFRSSSSVSKAER